MNVDFFQNSHCTDLSTFTATTMITATIFVHLTRETSP